MENHFRSWIQRQQARYRYRRGLDAASKGAISKAIETLMLATRHHPYPAQVYLALGNAYWQQERLEDAKAAFSQAIVCENTCERAYGNRGILHMMLNQPEAALADWEEGLAYNPNSSLLHYNRSLFYLQHGQPKAALADLNAALTANPNLAEAYFHRGNLRRDQGNWTEAIADWELALCNDLRLDQARLCLMQARQDFQENALTQKIQQAIEAPELTVKVQQNGSQLDIAIKRPKGIGVNYMTLPERIRSKLVSLLIPGIWRFKLTGQVGEQGLPEWQQIYTLYKNLPCPPTHWRTACLTALLLFPPFGIPALVCAFRVRQAYRRGDYPTAVQASHTTRALCMTGSALMSLLLIFILGYLGTTRLRAWVQSLENGPKASAWLTIKPSLPAELAYRPDLLEIAEQPVHLKTFVRIVRKVDESRGYFPNR